MCSGLVICCKDLWIFPRGVSAHITYRIMSLGRKMHGEQPYFIRSHILKTTVDLHKRLY